MSEIIKTAGDNGVGWLTNLCNDILAEGHISADWNNSIIIIVPLFKEMG